VKKPGKALWETHPWMLPSILSKGRMDALRSLCPPVSENQADQKRPWQTRKPENGVEPGDVKELREMGELPPGKLPKVRKGPKGQRRAYFPDLVYHGTTAEAGRIIESLGELQPREVYGGQSVWGYEDDLGESGGEPSDSSLVYVTKRLSKARWYMEQACIFASTSEGAIVTLRMDWSSADLDEDYVFELLDTSRPYDGSIGGDKIWPYLVELHEDLIYEGYLDEQGEEPKSDQELAEWFYDTYGLAGLYRFTNDPAYERSSDMKSIVWTLQQWPPHEITKLLDEAQELTSNEALPVEGVEYFENVGTQQTPQLVEPGVQNVGASRRAQTDFLYHGTTTEFLDVIGEEGFSGESYWTSNQTLAGYYADIAAEDEGGESYILKVPFSKFDSSKFGPDRVSILEPITFIIGKTEDEVLAEWDASGKTWQDSLRIVDSVSYYGALQMEDLKTGVLHRQAVIKKTPDKEEWCVYSEKGKSMGCYPSKAKAEERLDQIEMFKHMKGHRIWAMQFEEFDGYTKDLYLAVMDWVASWQDTSKDDSFSAARVRSTRKNYKNYEIRRVLQELEDEGLIDYSHTHGRGVKHYRSKQNIRDSAFYKQISDWEPAGKQAAYPSQNDMQTGDTWYFVTVDFPAGTQEGLSQAVKELADGGFRGWAEDTDHSADGPEWIHFYVDDPEGFMDQVELLYGAIGVTAYPNDQKLPLQVIDGGPYHDGLRLVPLDEDEGIVDTDVYWDVDDAGEWVEVKGLSQNWHLRPEDLAGDFTNEDLDAHLYQVGEGLFSEYGGITEKDPKWQRLQGDVKSVARGVLKDLRGSDRKDLVQTNAAIEDLVWRGFYDKVQERKAMDQKVWEQVLSRPIRQAKDTYEISMDDWRKHTTPIPGTPGDYDLDSAVKDVPSGRYTVKHEEEDSLVIEQVKKLYPELDAIASTLMDDIEDLIDARVKTVETDHQKPRNYVMDAIAEKLQGRQ